MRITPHRLLSGPPHRRIPGPALSRLEQLMDALRAGVILIDPTGVILSVNQAALGMHGVDRIEDLGITVDDYGQRFSLRDSNNHQLTRREYPLMRLLAGESLPDLIVEVTPFGQDEPRWVHQVRDVAMDDSDGDPECLALIIHDVSERYDAEERFEAMFQANPAPAMIVRAADQRFLRVNRAFIELSGFDRDTLIGKNLLEVDLFAEITCRNFICRQVASGETISPLETELPLAGGGTRLVLVAAQAVEVANERCLLFTFADLEPRRHAERARDASDAHFATVFQLAPVGMLITRGNTYRIVEVNEAFRHLLGYSDGETSGRFAEDLKLWGDAAEQRALKAHLDARGTVRNHDVRILHKNGGSVDCLLSAARISRRGEPCVLWLYEDITTRRHNELELVEAIDAVMQDASWFGRSIMDKLATLRRPAATGTPALSPVNLSPREQEVLDLICQGLDNTMISARLLLSPNTVRNHVAHLYAKVGVNRRAAAILWAREHGLH